MVAMVVMVIMKVMVILKVTTTGGEMVKVRNRRLPYSRNTRRRKVSEESIFSYISKPGLTM